MKKHLLGCAACVFATGIISVRAQGTAFTYQGRLNDGASPANGSYDLRLAVFGAANAGAPVAGPLTNSTTSVSNGLFTVTMDFGAGVFTGANRWLEIAVRTNGSGSFFTLNPRQALTPTPYAITAGNVVSGGLAAGTYGNAVTLNNAANQFTGSFAGNGSNVTNVNAASLNGLASSSFWQLGGNNILPGQFLGSANSQPLELRAGGARALRLEPNGSGAPNVIGGSVLNTVAGGVVGATIGGGGATNYETGTFLGNNPTNSVSANFGTIGGGSANSIQTGAGSSVIGGGFGNLIQSNAPESFIGGGNKNVIQGNLVSAVIGGGDQNLIQASASFATIGGGGVNQIQANAYEAVISGGEVNLIGANSHHAAIGGGGGNWIQSDTPYGAIFGGAANLLGPGTTNSFIGGGDHNFVTNVVNGTIGGGTHNEVSGDFGTIGGGYFNRVRDTNGTVAGGYGNILALSLGDSTIGGGRNNYIVSQGGVIAGGIQSHITGFSSSAAVGGGYQNFIESGGFAGTIGGGSFNFLTAQYATISGGYFNTNIGSYATVPGGHLNRAAGQYSFAAGQQAQALHQGAFVWADSTASPFASTGNDQFLVRASGGVGINTSNPAGAALAVVGGIRAGVNGTPQSRVQFGTATVGTGVAGVNTFTIAFPTAFSTTPKVFVMTKGNDNPDTFGISTRAVTTAGFKINIVRLDVVASGWGQALQVDWYAVE